MQERARLGPRELCIARHKRTTNSASLALANAPSTMAFLQQPSFCTHSLCYRSL